MSSGPHKFRQREITRTIRAARAAGAEIDRVEIEPDGRIVIHFANGAGEAGRLNSADAVLQKLKKEKSKHDGEH
jgi:hypothetical protein